MAAKKTAPKSLNNQVEQIDFYDHDKHSYEEFWVGREYEHESEVIALKRLLKGRHYALAMDFGGGYGRISPVILDHVDKLILVDPSKKQLEIGRRFLHDYNNVDFVRVDKKDTVPIAAGSLDLLVMVRVSHHLPDPKLTIAAIAESLKPGGEAIIEIANEAHFVNRLRYMKQLKAVPKQPVPVGSVANGIKDDTPFFNHHPKTIEAMFRDNGLKVVSKLSVSNLRHKALKEHLSRERMLALEKYFQGKLSVMDFGPSIFFLVRKLK